MTDGHEHHGDTTLAWGSWTLPLPEIYRPLTVEGTEERGEIRLAGGQGIFVTLRWGPRLASGSSASRGGVTVAAEDHAGHPHPQAAEACAAALQAAVRLVESGADRFFSAFHNSFVVPARFRLLAHRLNVGDMALSWLGERGERLELRQVYPATLALARQSTREWLDDDVWPRPWRHFEPEGRPRPARIDKPTRSFAAEILVGRSSLRAPLGLFARRREVRLVAEDAKRHRLLLGRFETRRDDVDAAAALLIDVVRKMNTGVARPTAVPHVAPHDEAVAGGETS